MLYRNLTDLIRVLTISDLNFGLFSDIILWNRIF